MYKNTPFRIVQAFLLFAVVHSLLASRQAKAAAKAVFGERYRNGLYRFGYNAFSVLWVVPATFWFSRLPDHELYWIRPPWSWFMRFVQVGSLGMAVSSAKIVGLLKITGIEELRDFMKGLYPEAEPEAQGPRLAPDGEMTVVGPFRISRHPLNLAPIGVFFFFPRMTTNRATLAALSAVYLTLGSIHEELRLRAAYGNPYENYQRSNVPFFIPTPEAIQQLESGSEVEQDNPISDPYATTTSTEQPTLRSPR